MTDADDVARRLSNLEDWRRELDVSRAREDENRKHMDARFDGLENRINSAIRWFLTTTGSAVLLVIVGFAMRGGFIQ